MNLFRMVMLMHLWFRNGVFKIFLFPFSAKFSLLRLFFLPTFHAHIWYGYETMEIWRLFVILFVLSYQMAKIWFVLISKGKNGKKPPANFTMKRCDLCDRQHLNKFVINYLKSFRTAWHSSKNVVSIHRAKNQWRSIPFLSTESVAIKLIEIYCFRESIVDNFCD